MIIKQLIQQKAELELQWIGGHYVHPIRGRRVFAHFCDLWDGGAIRTELPFGLLPMLVPGRIVSRGEVHIGNRMGSRHSVSVDDLSAANEVAARECPGLTDFYRADILGAEQRVLRYSVNGRNLLIPTVELIRFLFLHDRVLTEALLRPSGLTDLAVTPFPASYSEILIEFTNRVPQSVLKPDYIREFAWLAVDPIGRRAWDSVNKRSCNAAFLSFEPPSLRHCQLKFLGEELNEGLLVLELQSLSGRRLPASTINWTHPKANDTSRKGATHYIARPKRSTADGKPRKRKRLLVVDGEAHSLQNPSHNVFNFGGKRSSFENNATISRNVNEHNLKYSQRPDKQDASSLAVCHTSNSLVPVNERRLVTRQYVSIEEIVLGAGRPQIDISVLEHAVREAIGDLALLDSTLAKMATMHDQLKVSRSFFRLPLGTTFSYNGESRRILLLASFTQQLLPPRILIDVDRDGKRGLSAILMRYSKPTSFADVERHVMRLLLGLVDNYGRWDNEVEAQLSHEVSIKRLPRLLRLRQRREDPQYLSLWIRRLNRELQLDQLCLDPSLVDN